MALKMCPGCGRNVPETTRRCPACGWESNTHADLAANRFITWFTLYALGISVAGVVAVNHEYGQSISNDANDLITKLVLATIGSYVVLKLLNLRRHRKILMAAMGTGVLLTAGLYVGRTLLAQGALPMVTMSLPINADSSNGPATTQPAATQPAPVVMLSSEDYAPLMPIAKKAFAGLRQQPFALRSELDAAGVPKMLTTANLADPRRVSAARTRIARLYGRLDDYESTVHQLVRDALGEVRRADALDQASDQFIQSFKKVGGASENHAIGFIEFERRMLQQTDEMLKLTESAAGRFAVKSTGLVFTQKQEQTQYETLRRQLAATALREQELLRGFLASNDPSMQRLASALSRPAAAPAAGPHRSTEASAAE